MNKEKDLLDKLISLLVVNGDCPSQIDLKDENKIDGTCFDYSDATCKDCWMKALSNK